MNPALDFLSTHWLTALFLVGGLAVGLLAPVLRGRRPGWFLPLVHLGGALALAGAGGLILPRAWAWWLLGASGGVLCGMLLALVLTGAWWRPLAYGVVGAGLAAAGSVWLIPAGVGLIDVGRALLGTEFVTPWWLLLLGLVPIFVLLSWPRLNRTEVRPWVSLGLRCTLVILLALALAEPRVRRPNEHVTVLFVVDRSHSIPEELGEDPNLPGATVDQRALRIRDFINRAVQERGRGHARDQAGLIIFGRRPRLELPPSDAPRFNLRDLPGAFDPDRTDIAAALKLALASFPEGTAQRIVLVSDGNENMGNAEEQARLAQSLGVQIDVVPLGAVERNENGVLVKRSNQDEVLVERVDAPPLIEQGSQVPIRVLVRSYNPHIVVGRLTVRQITEGEVRPVGKPLLVKLRLGLNPFSFTRPLTDEQRSYTYEAEFQPEWVEDARGKVIHQGPPPGDRVQNNRASAHVVARGQRRILILENQKDSHRFLADRLAAAGVKKFKVILEPVAVLDQYRDPDKLAVYLSNFDCVILANVAADQVSEEQQEVFRGNTHDQGCGLVMIGGPEGFGAGGWQNTAVEKALPVDADIKSLKVQGKGGLVLIMHASEMADGNMWQKKIAKLAVERLGPGDEVGVIVFGFNCQWHVPLQEVGPNRADILKAIDTLVPGDMPDFDPALQMAHQALINPQKQFSTKHVIIISDGDPNYTAGVLAPMKRDKVTVTTVGVACHGANEDAKMADIARRTGGRPYSVKNPQQLPAIYIKESRLVSQAFVYDRRFQPLVAFRSGPTDRLPDPLLPLGGFVRTTPKGSPLVEIPILTPRFAGQDFPVLAYWHYGLGKAVAFTSDAGNPRFWSRAWAEGAAGREGMYAKFWEQVVDWVLRPVDSRRLNMTTEYRDGKIRILVDARTDDGRPDIHLKLRGGITLAKLPGHVGVGPPSPAEGAGQRELRFVQKNSGMYEVEVKAEDAGSYFITAQATRRVKVKGRDGQVREVEEGVDNVRGGLTLPYSPEYSDLETNTALLERLRELTGGVAYVDDRAALDEAAASGVVFRPGAGRVRSMQPLWYWLLALVCGLLLVDVAVRRLAVDPEEVAGKLRVAWARLRGQMVAAPARAEFMERLQTRKARVGEGLARAARRFEGEGVPEGTAPEGADAAAPPSPPRPTGPAAPAPGVAPQQPEPEAGDFAGRLLRAKKKVWEERKKEKPE